MCMCDVETDSMKCDICGREEAEWICVLCDNKMVCTDCDQKWHRHPKRRNHVREPLKSQQLKFASISSNSTSPGSFVRTKSVSERIEGLSALEDASLEKEFGQDEYAANVADVSISLLSSDVSETLRSEDPPTSQQTGMNLLPKCVAEINEDLSYQSLFGEKDSLVSQHNSTEQNERNYMPDAVRGSDSRHFSSLTSDFQSMLQSLQSKMDEVSSTVTGSGQNGSQDLGADDWSLPQAVNEHTVASNSQAYPYTSSRTVKNVESRQLVTGNADKTQRADDDNHELAMLLAQTKYPPSMDVSGSTGSASTNNMKNLINEHINPQNTGQSVDSKPSVLHRVTGGTEDTTLTKGSAQRLLFMHPYDLPRTNIQNTRPVENGLSDHTVRKDVLNSERDNFVKSGHQKTQSVVERQKSQTHVKERVTDLPGNVLTRVGDGKDLGVLARPSGGSEAEYHSKFTDIHDEVLLPLRLRRIACMQRIDVACCYRCRT